MFLDRGSFFDLGKFFDVGSFLVEVSELCEGVLDG